MVSNVAHVALSQVPYSEIHQECFSLNDISLFLYLKQSVSHGIPSAFSSRNSVARVIVHKTGITLFKEIKSLARPKIQEI